MKLLTKLSLVAVTFAVFGTAVAFADDQALQNRLSLERANNLRHTQQTTIGFYAQGHGIGHTDMNVTSQRSPSRFELRSNAHGQTFGVWVPVK